ncbi:hypothetical protein FF124_13030 [Martelella lutilitoris]|uniref:Uncharacterized protein n=1 Tax=Martelella lutilitoris TaxID=2583532 RepID=A0A5C4JPG8_9HYPH|nr:hypothetical protein [Martelella lutilitoris]TNB47101.1 hypothetical protein FF124_13030 [Martelella lutilitoris]
MESRYDALSAKLARMDGAALRAFLAEVQTPAGPEDLLAGFTWTTLSFLVEGRFFDWQGHDIARKLRGALWPVLVQTASAGAIAGKPCGNTPPSLLDLLWNDAGRLRRGRAIPKPWVIRAGPPVRMEDGVTRTVIEVQLFGLAAALHAAMRDVVYRTVSGGIGKGRFATRWRIVDDAVTTHEGLACETFGTVLGLQLLSPLRLTSDGRASFDYSAMLPGLIDRVEGLGLWQGRRLDCDFGALRAKARAIAIDTEDSSIYAWERRSTRANGKIPMEDTRGMLVLTGDFSGLEPFLSLLPVVHAGKDTRHGHGWCALLYPAD